MTAVTTRDDCKADVRLFGPFRLDVRDERLWKGKEELKIRRKPFAILRYLTSAPRRLVTQEQIVEAVWGKIAMSESLLRTNIGELRRVLGEDVIETVVGRGYRFLVDVEAEKPTAHSKTRLEAAHNELVGRSKEMGALRDAFEKALAGKRQMVFVTGDPGIGKTGLVDAFIAQVATPEGALVASGSCVEQFGAAEAYLPVLAALGAACRGPDGERIAEVLARHAPTWLAQMPGLVQDDRLQALLLRIQGATQARMLRELAEAFDVLASERPLLLVLEDMQWSDHATMDLIAMLGARREAARVLVIATCRPAELTKGEGLAKIVAQLGAHKQAVALHLATWPEAAVAEYLTVRFPNSRFPEQLATTLHRMAGGNPLFSGALVDVIGAFCRARHDALSEENIMSIGKGVSAVATILVGALAACGGAVPAADGAKVSSTNMQTSATEHAARTSVVSHPLDPADAPVTAALREMTRSAKGARQGIEARGQFDGFMGSVQARNDVTFEAGTLGGVPGIWVKPANSRPDEAILHLHGGWFSLGSAKGYRNLVAQIAARAGAKAFIADYRLAPEHPFPAATDDALAAYRALAGSGVRRVAITGDSAGGNLALVLASRVASEPGSDGATLVGVVALSPVTDLTLSGATYQTRADADPLFTRSQVAELIHSYLGSADAKQPLASPLFGRLSGMPPTRIHVGDDEVLLDDSLRFVERAVAAGVDARADVWMGMPHGFPASVGRLKAAGESLDAIGAFLTERLKAQPSP